jgi:hypothetical protein
MRVLDSRRFVANCDASSGQRRQIAHDVEEATPGQAVALRRAWNLAMSIGPMFGDFNPYPTGTSDKTSLRPHVKSVLHTLADDVHEDDREKDQ